MIYGKVVADRWQVIHNVAHGQGGLLDRLNKTVYTHIREPFLTAARQFRWKKFSPGLGLNREFVLWAAAKGYSIRVFVRGDREKCYEADASEWAEFVESTGSVWLSRSTALYELPWDIDHVKTVPAEQEDLSVRSAWTLLMLLEARKI